MRRISAAHGYLLPALSRDNLTLLTSATVTKLDIGGGQCRGVVASLAGVERRFGAAKEVIVCGGGLQSPKLLMLSGVGPADHLRTHGIAVVADSPRIGANLQDHLLVRLVFSTKAALPPQVDTGHAGVTYHKSNSSLPGPDIQIFGRLNAPNVQALWAAGFSQVRGRRYPQTPSRRKAAAPNANAARGILASSCPAATARNQSAIPTGGVKAITARLQFGLESGRLSGFGRTRLGRLRVASGGSRRLGSEETPKPALSLPERRQKAVWPGCPAAIRVPSTIAFQLRASPVILQGRRV